MQERFFDVPYNDLSLVREPSKKYITTYNKELTDIVSFINKIKPEEKKLSDNLSGEEREAMKELISMTRTDIEIKKADKSNTLVLMDKEKYRSKLVLEDHLYSPTYEKSDTKANERVYQDLIKLCDKHELCLTPSERKVILKAEWSESNFYILPKIHKSKVILDRIREAPSDYIQMDLPDDLKGRPINGDVNSVTHGLSSLLEKILKPLVPKMKSFIKDEFDFVDKIPRKVDAGVYAVSCDVTSLYTSIPVDLGIEAVDYWLRTLQPLVPGRFTREFVLEAIRFVLENNYFSFDEQIWHQVVGTAMGKSLAPPYACLTLGYLEETRLFPILLPTNFDADTVQLIIEYFFRYIDDGFNFLPLTVIPSVFLQVMNQLHQAFEYTMSLPSMDDDQCKSTVFLSIKVVVTPVGLVKTDIHYKETNAHDYLHFDSHHPQHTKINIPYTLAKRIYLLTSESTWIKRNLGELRNFLLDRKYPMDIVDRGIHNALLQGPAPEPQQKKKIPLVSTFYSNYSGRNILNVASDLISNSKNKRIKDAFKDATFIQSQRQPKNMLQILTNSRFITVSSVSHRRPNGIFHCEDSRCKICSLYLQICQSFVTAKGATWNVKCHATCNSKNVIYFLICNSCEAESYTGKTDEFRSRTNDHISKIRKGRLKNKFDEHVINCYKKRKKTPCEPFFKAYIFMVVKDYNKLLNLERQLHLAGHDTLNS